MLAAGILYALGAALLAIEARRPTIVVGFAGATMIVAAAAVTFAADRAGPAAAGLALALIVVPILYRRRWTKP